MIEYSRIMYQAIGPGLETPDFKCLIDSCLSHAHRRVVAAAAVESEIHQRRQDCPVSRGEWCPVKNNIADTTDLRHLVGTAAIGTRVSKTERYCLQSVSADAQAGLDPTQEIGR